MPAAYAHLMITEKTFERINDTFGNFEKDVFSKAVHHVMRKWTLLSEGMAQGDLSPFLPRSPIAISIPTETSTPGNSFTGNHLQTQHLFPLFF